MDLHHRTHPPVIFVDNFRDDPMDFESDEGLMLPVVKGGLALEPFMDSTRCQTTRMIHASVPVTPPRQCRQIVQMADFSCSSSFSSFSSFFCSSCSSSSDEGDEPPPESDLDESFPSTRRSKDCSQPQDPDSRQVAITYYTALTKLATSMRLSEETRSGIMLQRRVLYDLYGPLNTNHSLLCGTGSGAASDYEVSRNALMSYICDAMEQPIPLLRE
jgi:hypothetical protein